MEAVIPESAVSLEIYHKVAPRLQIEMDENDLKLGNNIFIRIFKNTAILELWMKKDTQYILFKAYSICDFSGYLGPKLREGDQQSPEGFYSVGINQLNPWSNYHLSFNIGFPNEYDLVHKRSGSALMVHGSCSSAGCFAMMDHQMNEIYTIAASALQSGQQYFSVHIFPFKMTWKNLALHRQSEWLNFWENLKEGYDFFLDHGIPPRIEVDNERYVFLDPTLSSPITSHSITNRPLEFAQLKKKRGMISNDK